jgi:hypothetical protein
MSEPRCPRDARTLRRNESEGLVYCTCGFSFTMTEWQESPHRVLEEFIYDLGRGFYIPPNRLPPNQDEEVTP